MFSRSPTAGRWGSHHSWSGDEDVDTNGIARRAGGRERRNRHLVRASVAVAALPLASVGTDPPAGAAPAANHGAPGQRITFVEVGLGLHGLQHRRHADRRVRPTAADLQPGVRHRPGVLTGRPQDRVHQRAERTGRFRGRPGVQRDLRDERGRVGRTADHEQRRPPRLVALLVTQRPAASCSAAVPPDGPEDLWVIDLATGAERQLTDSPDTDEASPDWSADGRRIVFQGDLAEPGNYDVYSIRPDGTGLRRLTRSAAFDGDAHVSRDGDWIVFGSDRTGNAEVYVMRSDGSGVRRVTRDPSFDAIRSSPLTAAPSRSSVRWTGSTTSSRCVSTGPGCGT